MGYVCGGVIHVSLNVVLICLYYLRVKLSLMTIFHQLTHITLRCISYYFTLLLTTLICCITIYVYIRIRRTMYKYIYIYVYIL